MTTWDGSIDDPRYETEPTSAVSPPPPPDAPSPAPVRDPSAYLATEASLVITRGPASGTRFPLTQGITTIGRSRDCDIVLEDVTVSRQHAEIRHEQGQFVIRDCGSLNSTYLNRSPVREAPLAEGDEVWIGKFRLAYHRKL
ncbi:FHA domain-containing protein [Amycolatopsis anabasis]|uniref:FHA domain-containing protein n=1 Tax=Amycolatopsis anabasis TaxID=1840409 RepID=UPI00131CAF92|nr:FHA domain-containing protein [Amycolatopsis anabasis]